MNDISIAIKVSGYSPLLELNTILGLMPTECHMKGELYNIRIPGGLKEKQYPTDYWEYRREFKTDEWIQLLINAFITEVIESRKDKLKRISEVSSLEFFVGVNYYNEANPSFHFNSQELQILSYIGADIDIDMYCLSR